MHRAPPPLQCSSPPRPLPNPSPLLSSSSPSSHASPSSSSTAFHTSVQETCMEALNGKASCVSKQYYNDRFIRLFRPTYPPPPAMSPLINRGYFTRVRALELIVRAFDAHVLATAASSSSSSSSSSPFFSSSSSSSLPPQTTESTPPSASSPPSPPRVNLVLLGAGLDTFFLRLQEQEEKQKKTAAAAAEASAAGASAAGGVRRCYYEVDFAPVVRYKARCIEANEGVASLVGLSTGEEAAGGGRGGGGGGGGGGDGGRPQRSMMTGSALVLHSSNSNSRSNIRSHSSRNQERKEEEKRSDRQGGGGGGGGGGCYALLAGDLADTKALEKTLEEAGIEWELPTLLIAECVLVYMETEASQALVEWTATKFPVAAFVSYDMILPHDVFGRMMRNNLECRGLILPGFETWGRNLQTQLERFVVKCEREGGNDRGEKGTWERAIGGDMNAVYDCLLETGDRENAMRLEHLDEVEEWHMLMGHYCYVVATQGAALRTLLQDQPGFQERARGGGGKGAGEVTDG